MAVLSSPVAQPSQMSATAQNVNNQLSSSRNGPQSGYGSRARKNAIGVSIQLLIFPSHNIMGAIDVLLLWVGRQQVDLFVGALWICSKFSCVGTGAKIR